MGLEKYLSSGVMYPDDFIAYFLNDLYDDDIIERKYHDFQNRLYNGIMNGKGYIQNNRIINGNTAEIRINNVVNQRFRMPRGTYSLLLNFCLIPFYSHNKFMRKYGFEKVISSLSILNDITVFPSYVSFFINDTMIHEFKVVIRENETYLFFPTTDGVSGEFVSETLQRLLSSSSELETSWTIRIKPRSDFYETYMARVNLFHGNKIYLKSFTTKKRYPRPTKNNFWTLYMTHDPKSSNAMTATSAVLKEDAEGEYFEIPEEFKNYIYSKVNVVKCFVMNDADYKGSGTYTSSPNVDAVFQIPYEKNPIPIRNIFVWEYDASTGRKLHPMETSAVVTYPNIYNFSEMFSENYFMELYDRSRRLVIDASGDTIVLKGKYDIDTTFDLFFEWEEPMYDCSAFDTPIQSYMDFYGDLYPSMKLTNSAHYNVLSYEPLDMDVLSLENFLTGPNIFGTDYRGWRLRNFIYILYDNPTRFNEYFHAIYDRTKRFINRSYNYQTSPHIYNRSITSNRHQVKEEDEVLINFSEPHSYVEIYDATVDQKFCDLYIDGLLKQPTHVTKWGHTLYIYFPKRWIANHEPIHIELHLSRDWHDMEKKPIIFDKDHTEIDFEDLGFENEMCLADIFLQEKYYTMTKYEFENYFKLSLKTNLIEKKYNGFTQNSESSVNNTDTVLYTAAKELFVPGRYDAFVLGSKFETTDCEAILSSNMKNYKKINMGNLLLSAKPEFPDWYENLTIRTCDFFFHWIYTITSDMISTKEIDGKVLPCCTIPDRDFLHFPYTEYRKDLMMNLVARIKTDNTKFSVFLDGRFVSNAVIYRTFFIDKDNYLVIALEDGGIFRNFTSGQEITVNYQGYDQNIMVQNTIGKLQTCEDKYGGVVTRPDGWLCFLNQQKDDESTNSEYKKLQLPFDWLSCKLYIDGYRITQEQCEIIDGNMFALNNEQMTRSFTDNSEVCIVSQSHDHHVYLDDNDEEGLRNIMHYKFRSNYMDHVLRDDPNFRAYYKTHKDNYK